MKRFTLFLVFILGFCVAGVVAQPTFKFMPQTSVVDAGQTVCLDVRVEDFTDLLGVKFSIKWDTGVVKYQGIQNLNPNVTGLDMADFGLGQTNEGIVVFNWSNGQPCQGAISGVTLPDDAVLFRLCFIATGEYGNHTWVEITDMPLDRYVTRLNANCNDIGEFVQPGYISVGTPPITVNVSSADGFTDEMVCLDFTVEDFDSILSFQFSIRWDSSKLQFHSVTGMNLPEFGPGNFGKEFVENGVLITSWSPLNPPPVGVSLADGTQIIQVCFKIIGACGQSTPVYVSDSPTPIEVVNFTAGGSFNGNNIGLLQNEGLVTVKCFNPDGITVEVEDKDVCPGEVFTVDVRVSDFDQIARLEFNLQYNPNVIALVNPKLSFPQAGGCFNFNNGTVVNVNTPGLVKVNWTMAGLPCTLPDDFILFRLHFMAVGPSGSNTNISVVNPIFVDRFLGPIENIGINNNNGFVSICQIDSPTFVIASQNANPGDTICLPVTIKDFEDITRLQYTISWEPNLLQFIGINGMNIPGLSMANFYTTQAVSLGLLGMEWEDAGGVTLPDGTVVFELCFRVKGSPNNCGDIIFSDWPYPTDVQTLQSNNTNIGINGQPSKVCIENPFIFEVQLPDVINGPNTQVCVDVKVKNFKQLTHLKFKVVWNPTILQYDTVLSTAALPSFTPASYDDSPALTQNGELQIDWDAPNQILGVSVPDGQSIFRICFTLIGNPGQCSPLSVPIGPGHITEVNSATTGDANLSMTVDAGSVCLSAVLTLVDAQITHVDCPGQPTGAIDITVAGGSGNYTYQWTGPGVVPDAEDQSGLDVGTYRVTVTDANNPGLFLNLTYTVGYSANATIADAGNDTTFACGNFFLTLNGSGSSSGPDIVYFWESISGGGLVLPGEQNKQNPKIIGGQCYRLTVTNLSTGCVATDEVCIAAPVLPVPEAESSPVGQIDCVHDTIELDGSLSTFGFQVLWTTDTGQIVPGTETLLTPKVTAPGWYYLTLSNPETGCSATDSVYVPANLAEPVADGGVDTILGCNDNSVVLSGPGTSAGPNYIYEWQAISGGEICGSSNQPSVTVCAPGQYQLVVTDTTNGCTASDVVVVEADTLKPVIDAGPDTVLTCIVSSIQLQGTIFSGSGDYDIQWLDGGGNIVSGQGTLQPIVDAPATYTLQVTDQSNGCMAFSEVVVDANTDLPTVAASVDGPISCLDPEAKLSAAGSSMGSIYTYVWLDGQQNTVSNDTAVVVSVPGTYKLVVSNTSNGCKDSTEVEVVDWTTPPMVDAGDSAAITCVIDAPTLSATVDTGNPNLVLQWSGPVGNCIQNGNSPNPTVSCIGTYILTVYDSITGCIAKDTTWVIDDMQPPGAEAGPADTLTCAKQQVQLQGSTNAANILVSWESVPPGLPIQNPTTLTPTVSTAGSYVLTVTSLDNGCTSTDIVNIGVNTTPPMADAGQNDTTDCQKTLGTLDASASLNGTTQISWKAISGSIDPGDINEPVISVGPGIYELTVVSLINGCESKDTVQVVDNSQKPAVNVNPEVSFGCTDSLALLDATGSATGPAISYAWKNDLGMTIGTELTHEVDTTGTYVFVVIDQSNGCSDSAVVNVVAVVDGEPALAMADADPCSSEAMLIGNLPAGATGVWTSTSAANIEDPTAATTLVTGLSPGDNVFTWTLSIGRCIAYSSAEVVVSLNEGLVTANFDQATVDPTVSDTLSLNLLANDVYSAGADFYLVTPVELVPGLTVGEGGQIQYVRPRCFSGTLEFQYALCSMECPDMCDTTNVRIFVEPDENEDCNMVPNGITPNGDGVNDALIFDLILNNPGKYPNSEIIIFNRWGDVVYKASPYNNDWRGTNNSGQDLPQGTYYYILNLNIANSEIIRGNVTIIR